MQESQQKPPSRAVYRTRRIVAILLVVGVVGGLGYFGRGPIRAGLDVAFGAEYIGSGHGETQVAIYVGDDGEDVARALVAAGVTKTFRSTYASIVSLNPVFYPGVYRLSLGMHSSLAVKALTDKNNLVGNSVLVREGNRASTIFKLLSEAYGLPISDFEAVKPSDIGLPKDAVNLDGYLFPAKYAFVPGQTATEMLKAMYDRMVLELDHYGISKSDYHRVLTMASVIQREGKLHEDLFKISRVFLNRIERGMPLQSDATVSYGVGSSTFSTTAAERANDNPWNTYLYPGLPIGPISAPGSAAIDAALHPAVGAWLYFCTVNLKTGETEFSSTYAEHERSVAKWRAWMRANPGWK